MLCKVNKVTYNSVFVNLEEYRKQGMIHISEVSPGRIRNINDFVKQGKTVVCKVLKVNEERGHIDLSLRRVNDNQKRKKLNMIKLELKAEKIIEDVAKKLGLNFEEFYYKVAEVPMQEFDSVYAAFEAVIEDDYDLSNLNLSKKETEALEKVIKERIKPKSVEIHGVISVKTYEPNGVELVKQTLKVMKDDSISIKYLGAGKFKFELVAQDYPKAEALLKRVINDAENFAKKHKVEFSFVRKPIKK